MSENDQPYSSLPGIGSPFQSTEDPKPIDIRALGKESLIEMNQMQHNEIQRLRRIIDSADCLKPKERDIEIMLQRLGSIESALYREREIGILETEIKSLRAERDKGAELVKKAQHVASDAQSVASKTRDALASFKRALGEICSDVEMEAIQAMDSLAGVKKLLGQIKVSPDSAAEFGGVQRLVDGLISRIQSIQKHATAYEDEDQNPSGEVRLGDLRDRVPAEPDRFPKPLPGDEDNPDAQ